MKKSLLLLSIACLLVVNPVGWGSQKTFVDNLDFNAGKYGYVDFTRYFGNGQTGQRPDPKVFGEIREKMKVGREEQVKLNNSVLAMLTKNK